MVRRIKQLTTVEEQTRITLDAFDESKTLLYCSNNALKQEKIKCTLISLSVYCQSPVAYIINQMRYTDLNFRSFLSIERK